MIQIAWKCRCGKATTTNAVVDPAGEVVIVTLCLGCGEPHQLAAGGATRLSWPVLVQLLQFEPERLASYTRARAVLRALQ